MEQFSVELKSFYAVYDCKTCATELFLERDIANRPTINLLYILCNGCGNEVGNIIHYPGSNIIRFRRRYVTSNSDQPIQDPIVSSSSSSSSLSSTDD